MKWRSSMICPKCGSVNVHLKDKETGVQAPFCNPCEEFIMPLEEKTWNGEDIGSNKIIYKILEEEMKLYIHSIQIVFI